MNLFQRYKKYLAGKLLLFLSLLFSTFLSIAQNNNVQLIGKVVDDRTKEPLVGAVVHIKGTTHHVVADEEGAFTFITGQKVPVVYEVSHVGYETREITVSDYKPIDIRLKQGNAQLSDVVVVGYGTQRRSDVSGAVTTVPKNLLTQPATSFDNLLQGAVPGVAVTQSSAQPGSTASIRVRGGNSISFGNEPLYVIDGFIIYNNNSFTNSGASNGSSVNALATINPSDIESIEILKDASATAIYGSRGANGVVVITTRRGKKGTDEFNYSGYFGKQQVSKKLDLLNASQWAALVNDINYSDGKAATFSDSAIAALGSGSDWQSSALRDAPVQNHELSLAGGDDKSRYLISGNYFNQQGTVLNTGFKRYSARLNYERNVTDRFKVAANIFGSRSLEDKLTGSPFNSINFSGAYPSLVQSSPVALIKNGDGTYNTTSPYTSQPTNPLLDIIATTNRSYLTRVMGSASAEYKLWKELVLKVTGGVDLINTKQNYYAPSYTNSPAGSSNGYTMGGYGSVGTVAAVSWLNENTLTWDHTWQNTHFVNLLAGYTTQFSKDESAVASSQKFPNDLTTYNNLSYAGSAVLSLSDAHQSTLNSYLARVNYSYLHKYNITLSERADGSSRLGANNKWGYFPSIGLSWNINKEDFFQRFDRYVSNLKLRLTAGKTGNSEVPPYSSLAALAPTNYYFNSTLVTGISPVQLANPNLKWETTTQYNAGVDVGLFNGRINLTFDAYYKKTSDLLLYVPFPLYTGYTSQLENVGSVENKGVELGLSTENVKSKNFNWRSTFLIAANRNKVLSLGASSSYFPVAPTGQVSPVIVQVGLPVGTFWGYSTNGLLTAEDLSKGAPVLAGVAQKVGDTKYVDYTGDGAVTTADKHNLGSAQPKFTASFSNNISWKHFDLSFFIQGSYGNKLFNLLQQKLEIPTISLNASAALLNRYSATNPNGTVARATNSPVPQVTDRYIEDGSYAKLKNITLGYNFSSTILSKIRAKQLRVYVSAQNLLTLTHYTGYNPEVNFYDNDNTKQGIDYGIYPATRTFLAGVNITF
ncbi:SusC/RagA family protein [Niastella koreensis]|uniref:TonB-dependent receptor n=2 Tax=Niastella koreensis TaxID=354356 RepID=G8TN63_NIAKG|nr:TonB-dependent receptor [Niastella koreensis]AEV97748.1 TonB-dependent receptor [Niastella koreensis GR20-10]OQP40436.1 SusC/RagA family protein [Niastella koreensis]